ncbi:MAG: hypothetical protein IJV41_02990 [Oscillospiraceae bacterium]|nr:hypothetical protein [Oscillospiraceae bacterium]
MKKRGTVAARLFRAVCLSFSALLLVMSLLQHVRLTGCEAEIERLQLALSEERDRQAQLEIRISMLLPLSELEAYAVQVLGMQHPTQSQITWLDKVG